MDGAACAVEASLVLEEAWQPPTLRYSPEYLRWQLSFPEPLPAVLAFHGAEPAGFAGITARRLRHRSLQWDSGIVSFVAVRPRWRGQGLAAQLYRRLLDALRGKTLVTFAESGSAGERALLRAYPDAGFRVEPLGLYPLYTALPRPEAPDDEWEAEVSGDPHPLPAIVEACASDESLIWSDPSEAQIAHYLQDPRPRKLLLVRRRNSGILGAAWAVRAEYRTARGVDAVTTLESLSLPRRHADALPALLRCAAGVWPSPVISAPSLCGFDPAILRRAGIRRTGAQFQARLCATALPEALQSAQGASLEVI